MNTDRREGIRVPLLLPLECHGFGGENHDSLEDEMTCQNLSCHGMSITSEAALGVGKTFRFSLGFPNQQDKKGITGEVRWRSGSHEKKKMGIQFSKPLDCPIPFSAAETTVSNLQQDVGSHFGLLYQTISDACVWIDSTGNIVRHDERFANLIGCSEGQVMGKSIVGLAHPDDRKSLSDLLNEPHSSGLSSPTTGLFRIQPNGGQPLFWKIQVLPKPVWSTSREIYIHDMTEYCQLKREKHYLEQVVSALERSVPGQVISLNTDLSIVDVRGTQAKGKGGRRKARFNGMALRKATNLAETKVNGKKLFDELQRCAQTGQEFSGKCVHYQGRSSKTPDLFTPGPFHTKISPICNLEDKVSSLLMVVMGEDPLGIFSRNEDKKAKNLNRLQHILWASSAGFLFQGVLEEVCNPFMYVLAELDLQRHKLDLDGKKGQLGSEHEATSHSARIEKAGKCVGDFSEKLKCVLENACRPEHADISCLGVNECLSKAINIVDLYEGLDVRNITLKARPKLPLTASNEQELTMIFLVFLLLSRDSLRSVSDTSITCKTAKDENHIIAEISHNGHIEQGRYLDIIFHKNPLESFFLNSDTIGFMDTLLYYANVLLKKNEIKIRITNIPGQFDLSVVIPAMRE
jgi:PAS domain S-box-containing protein